LDPMIFSKKVLSSSDMFSLYDSYHHSQDVLQIHRLQLLFDLHHSYTVL
jgi:hypothetical protein